MITATILAHSKAPLGDEVVTWVLEYPRYIHSELMTHRVFSRNAASSRAIPIEKMIEQATQNTVMPMWSHNQAGMQGKLVTDLDTIHAANNIIAEILQAVVSGVRQLDELGIHKQNANRYLEPFQHIRTIVTSSQLDNFFQLRAHPDAQPEIQQLAKEMLASYSMSEPVELKKGEWHLPGVPVDFTGSLREKQMISASVCAQVSYRKEDASLEKAEKVFDRLITSEPLHASPMEHQCRPLEINDFQKGNLIGFRQLRQDIEDGSFSN